MINEKGLIKIGKEFTKVTYDYVYISEKDVFSNNNVISAGRNELVQRVKVERTNSSLDQRLPSKDCRKDYSHGRRLWSKKQYRFRGRLWTLSIGPFYSGIGANSTHYLKTAGVWYRDKAPSLRLKYDVIYEQTFQGTPLGNITENYDSGNRSQERRIEKTFQFCALVSCDFRFKSANSLHTGIGENNSSWSCNLSL